MLIKLIYMRFCIRIKVLNIPYSANTQPIRNYDNPEDPE